jgi:hypothetical protein
MSGGIVPGPSWDGLFELSTWPSASANGKDKAGSAASAVLRLNFADLFAIS